MCLKLQYTVNSVCDDRLEIEGRHAEPSYSSEHQVELICTHTCVTGNGIELTKIVLIFKDSW